MIKALTSLLVMVAVLTQAGLATAQSHPAINFDADNPVAGDVSNAVGDGIFNYWTPLETEGWGFLLSEPALLTHLAMYDYQGDGLQNDFRVGIWGSGDFFVDGTVVGGEEAPLVGSWRQVDIEDVVLQPGYYTIGARMQSDQNELCNLLTPFCDPFGNPPEIIEDQFLWHISGGFGGGDVGDPTLVPNDFRVDVSASIPFRNEATVFSRPTTGFLINGAVVGPNFFLAPVPEPTTGLLAAIAILFAARLPREWLVMPSA